jgi:hypothetical protein
MASSPARSLSGLWQGSCSLPGNDLNQSKWVLTVTHQVFSDTQTPFLCPI